MGRRTIRRLAKLAAVLLHAVWERHDLPQHSKIL